MLCTRWCTAWTDAAAGRGRAFAAAAPWAAGAAGGACRASQLAGVPQIASSVLYNFLKACRCRHEAPVERQCRRGEEVGIMMTLGSPTGRLAQVARWPPHRPSFLRSGSRHHAGCVCRFPGPQGRRCPCGPQAGAQRGAHCCCCRSIAALMLPKTPWESSRGVLGRGLQPSQLLLSSPPDSPP